MAERPAPSPASAVRLAAVTATLMLAQQIAAKTARDAFFLDAFGVAALPTMFVAAALASIATVPFTTRLLARHGPARVVPATFAASAALLAVQWTFAAAAPRLCALTLYLHVAAINAVLISWFWSLVNERFDPRAARRGMRVMGGGAALGGLVGGLVAERSVAAFGGPALLLVLGALHVLCALGTARMSRGAPRSAPAAEPPAEAPPGLRLLARSSYVRDLASLVLVGTILTALVNYVFKSQVVAAYGRGPSLVRFFAIFYGLSGLASFVVQTLVSPAMLEKLGLARTIAAWPVVTAVGSGLALAVPGLASATLLRGTELAVHNSAFRSGYELLYTPLPPREKRKLKTMIDVGFDRAGDMIGGGILGVVVTAFAAATRSVLLAMVVALSLVSLWLAMRLHRGYIRALERSLRERTVEVDADDVRDSTTLSVMLSLGGTAVPAAAPAPAPAAPAAVSPPADPVLLRIAALRSSDPAEVRAALAAGPLDGVTVPHAIALLAWDAVAAEAIAALRRVAGPFCGQLLDAMLSPDEDFAVRRRLPRVLSEVTAPRAIDGLLRGLEDARFEVRYRCGRALTRIHLRSPETPIDRERVLGAVRREATVDRGVWEGQRLLNQSEDPEEPGFIDELVRDRASRSLEHVFTLLALAFPREALQIAFRGLHTSDEMLRGTALEYLEGVLPEDVRARLWTFLEDRRPGQRAPRPADAVLQQLLLSNQSIQVRLEMLRHQARADAPDRHEP